MGRSRVLSVVLVLVFGGAALVADGVPVPVGDMMARAEHWYRLSPRYDQDRCFSDVGYSSTDWEGVLGGCHKPAYRTDCSGFVSMVWGLPVSYATPRDGLDQDLADVARVIERSQLRAGDALLAHGRHVRLFERWVDADRTLYWAYDFGATPVKHQVYEWGAPGEYDYVPIRLNQLR